MCIIKMNKNDARYIRTHKVLQDAFEKLIIDSDPGKINVSSITHAANVNRRTFYLHFDTIEDMFDELAEKLANDLSKKIAVISWSDAGDITTLVSKIIGFIEENKPLHKKLICSDDYSKVFKRVSERLAGSSILNQTEVRDPTKRFYYQLRLESTSYSIMNSIRQWLILNEPVSTDDLINCIVELTGL